MPRVSLTKFLDFIAQTGEPKAGTAISAWTQSNSIYDPKRDYHKRVREALIAAQKSDVAPNWEKFLEEQNAKKQKNFRQTIVSFEEWRTTYDQVSWFAPPRANWNAAEFHITVNPELGLRLDGKNYAIKLYLNRTKLSKLKAQTGCLLMSEALADLEPSTSFAIFDVKGETFHEFQGASEKLRLNLLGEAAHMSAIIAAIRAA